METDPVTPINKPSVRHRIDLLVFGLLLVSLALNVYLGWRLKSSAKSTGPSAAKLAINDRVQPLVAYSLEGQPQTIRYDDTDKPTVFYLLSPQCVWCERNQPNLLSLMSQKRSDFRFIVISLTTEGIKEYLAKNKFDAPTYAGLSDESIRAFGLGTTPQTIVISPEGKVLRNWTGAFGEKVQKDVEDFFQASLPGITQLR